MPGIPDNANMLSNEWFSSINTKTWLTGITLGVLELISHKVYAPNMGLDSPRNQKSSGQIVRTASNWLVNRGASRI
jgi:hypothetical protein